MQKLLTIVALFAVMSCALVGCKASAEIEGNDLSNIRAPR
jgi:outer membrane lipoprotein SlyB